MKSNTEKKNVADVIAARFVDELNRGVAPWAKGFNCTAPKNAVSKKAYRGINYFLLSMLGIDYACTYKQAQAMGGSVKKGAKGIPVVFWTFIDKKDKATGAPTIGANGKPLQTPFMRYYTVFAMSDTEGTGWIAPDAAVNPDARHDDAESLFAKVQGICKFEIRNGGNQPCFIPALNVIEMPEFERWTQACRFYKTLFHECGHALGKVTGKQFAHAGDGYATEELVAELFASAMLSLLGINSPECWDNSVAYVQTWAKRLTDEPQAIISAAQEAQKRIDLIFPRETGEEKATAEVE